MEKQSLSQNFIYQFLYQGLVFIVPLIISPYLTRTLRETSLGIYTYVNSVAYYFVIIAMLGISRHGQRLISQNSHDEILLRKSFWSLFIVHIITSCIALLLYLFFVFFIVNENQKIYMIEFLYVMSAVFDLTWLFYGLENFKSVVVRSAIIKILQCVLIFLFVKSPQDLWIYTIICAGGTFCGQIIMIPLVFRIVKPISFNKKDLLQHVKPLIIFSVSVIAVSLYTVFDKILLGVMTNKENVAFYEYSNRIINMPKIIIGVIGTVMYPRACRLAANGNIVKQKYYLKLSFFLASFISMVSIFGLLGLSDLFVVLYYGKSFAICGGIIKMLCPLIYIIGIGDVIRTQYMIPNGMDGKYAMCLVINAVVNLALTYVLIPILGIYGAVIGTLAAELFGLIYQTIVCRTIIKIWNIYCYMMPFAIIGLLMYGVLKAISLFIQSNLIGLLIQGIIGIIAYLSFSFIYVFLFDKNLWNMIVSKFIKTLKGSV